MCDSDIPACIVCSATSHPRWLSCHDTPSCGTLLLHNAYWSLIFIMKRWCFTQLIMYSPQLSQLAVAGSGLTVVSHTVLPHSFSLKPPVVLWFYTDSPSRALSFFCPLIGLYIRVFSEIVLISPSLLLLAVSHGDQKPKQGGELHDTMQRFLMMLINTWDPASNSAAPSWSGTCGIWCKWVWCPGAVFTLHQHEQRKPHDQ